MDHRSAHSSSWDQHHCLAEAKEGCHGEACQFCRLARNWQYLVGNRTALEAALYLAWETRASVVADLGRRTRWGVASVKHGPRRAGVDGRWRPRVEEGKRMIWASVLGIRQTVPAAVDSLVRLARQGAAALDLHVLPVEHLRGLVGAAVRMRRTEACQAQHRREWLRRGQMQSSQSC